MSVIRLLTIVILVGASLDAGAQAAKSPLSRVVNVPGTTQIAPSLSGDGKHMIFTSTSNLKGELLVFYSYQQRPGKWTQPEPVTTINRSLPINHIGGYSLSYDGNYIYFTSRKSYGIGKFDIWYSKRTGKNQWSTPVNLAKPVNSTQDDGCPSISPDGKALYFVRCESMDLKEGTGCRLMMAEKRNQEIWGEPVALPEYINDGNVMSPRILADNQTLIYAKGNGDAWDLYQTRLIAGNWSRPVALDYVNTASDERFASIPATGDVLYYSTKFKGNYDIVKAKIPQEMQPLKVVYLKGDVTDANGHPLEAFIQVYDVENKKLELYHRTDQENADFEFFLAAGKQYDFSVVPLSQGYFYYSEIFDLQDLSASTRRKMNIVLDILDPGASFQLPCLMFDNDSTLNTISRFELSRIIKLLKNNPGTKVEIAVHRESWPVDSLSQPDSMLISGLPYDTTYIEEPLITESGMVMVDSLQLETDIFTSPQRDPTEIQAKTISDYFQERGVPDYILITKGYADTEPITGAGDTDEKQALSNRRVEIRIL